MLIQPSQFGAVKGIRLNLDDKGECKGYAFVEFEDEVRRFFLLLFRTR